MPDLNATEKLYRLKKPNENEYRKGVFLSKLCRFRDSVMKVTGFNKSEVNDMIYAIYVD